MTNVPTGNCSNNCFCDPFDVQSIRWSQLPITTTYTVVLVVNKKTNSTQTTTVSNTEIDFGNIVTPTNLNGDGTVTASAVDSDGNTRIL